MRLIATSDLHYDIARSRGPTEALARRLVDEARQRGPATAHDCLLLVGDVAGADKQCFEQCLALFADFPGPKFFVAGNLSLWSRNGDDALTLLREELPARAARFGFGCLEFQPAILGPVGLVGTVGWYDYSFRRVELAVPLRFYRSKVAPGAARFFREHRELLAVADDLTAEHRRLTARWMDGVHVKLPMGDEAFTAMLADKLARQLDETARRVDRIIVAIHHVPLAELMPRWPGPAWQFVAAYMGSERFGRVCLACPKVTHVLCGHTHQPARARVGQLEAISIGSDYRTKRTVELEFRWPP